MSFPWWAVLQGTSGILVPTSPHRDSFHRRNQVRDIIISLEVEAQPDLTEQTPSTHTQSYSCWSVFLLFFLAADFSLRFLCGPNSVGKGRLLINISTTVITTRQKLEVSFNIEKNCQGKRGYHNIYYVVDLLLVVQWIAVILQHEIQNTKPKFFLSSPTLKPQLSPLKGGYINFGLVF